MSPAVNWPVLLAVTGAVLPWGPVLAASAAALAVAGLLAVLPSPGAGVLLPFAVLVLACGAATAGEDPSAGPAATTPVGARRRLLARLLLVLPVSATALAGVLAVAALAGVSPGRGPVLLWLSLTAVATAVGAAAGRGAADVPAPVAAVAVLGAGTVLAPLLPGAVTGLAPWDTPAERVGWALAVSAVVVLRVTRDRTG